MFQVNNLFNNANAKVIEEMGGFKVFEYEKDLSVTPDTVVSSYFASKMNVRRRQVLVTLNGDSYTLQAGAMQWTCGNIQMNSGIKGVGDFFGKAFSAAVTKETVSKPVYAGSGLLMLEPTYKHILLLDVGQWNGLVLEDGLFLACQSQIQQRVIARSNLSSAALGNEGLFNLCLLGNGLVALESPVPKDELIDFNLNGDELKIDGSMAIAWSSSLQFTVERSSRSLIGSAASGEGLVNVYRGTGRVLMAPVA